MWACTLKGIPACAPMRLISRLTASAVNGAALSGKDVPAILQSRLCQVFDIVLLVSCAAFRQDFQERVPESADLIGVVDTTIRRIAKGEAWKQVLRQPTLPTRFDRSHPNRLLHASSRWEN